MYIYKLCSWKSFTNRLLLTINTHSLSQYWYKFFSIYASITEINTFKSKYTCFWSRSNSASAIWSISNCSLDGVVDFTAIFRFTNFAASHNNEYQKRLELELVLLKIKIQINIKQMQVFRPPTKYCLLQLLTVGWMWRTIHRLFCWIDMVANDVSNGKCLCPFFREFTAIIVNVFFDPYVPAWNACTVWEEKKNWASEVYVNCSLFIRLDI